MGPLIALIFFFLLFVLLAALLFVGRLFAGIAGLFGLKNLFGAKRSYGGFASDRPSGEEREGGSPTMRSELGARRMSYLKSQAESVAFEDLPDGTEG